MEKLTLNSDHGSACSTASYGKKRTAGYDIQNKLVCLTYNRKDNPWKEEDVDEMYKKFASDEFYSGDAEVTVALEEPNHLHMIYSRSAAGARIDCRMQRRTPVLYSHQAEAEHIGLAREQKRWEAMRGRAGRHAE